MNKQDSKGLNVSHIKKYRDKIEELEDIIIKLRIALNRYKKGWTNSLFWYILGVSSLWLFLLISSLVF